MNRHQARETLLLLDAARVGHVEATKVLLEKSGIRVLREGDVRGDTALHVAARAGHAEVVRLLLARPDIEIDRGTYTPLYIAAEKGNANVVAVLLEKGADVDKADNDGATSLYIAAQKDNADVVALLLKKGANPEKASNSGFTPLHVACQNGFLFVANVLLAKGADPEKASNIGFAPLHLAAQRGRIKVAALLLEKGVDVDKADNDGGVTPLYLTAAQGHTGMATLLLEKGADPEKASHSGATPLAIASQEGHGSMVALLKKRAKVDMSDEDGCTPFDIATLSGREDDARALMPAGGDRKPRTKAGGAGGDIKKEGRKGQNKSKITKDTETVTGIRLGPADFTACDHCEKVSKALEVCTLCGTVAYCSDGCRTDGLVAHEYMCHLLRVNYTPEIRDCIDTLLHDRDFAGHYSLFQHLKFQEMGEGVVVAQLSHPLSEYCYPRNPARTGTSRRTISLSFLQDSTPATTNLARAFREERTAGCSDFNSVHLLLNYRMLPEVDNKHDLDESLFPLCRMVRDHTFQGAEGMRPGNTFTMVIQAPQHTSIWLLTNWLDNNHFTFKKFSVGEVQQLNWESFASRTIVGQDFHRRCMENRAELQKNPRGTHNIFPPHAMPVDYVAKSGDLCTIQQLSRQRGEEAEANRKRVKDAKKSDINYVKPGREALFTKASAQGPTCPLCMKPAHLKCSKCNSAFYCGKDHQKQDWPAHKMVCQKSSSIEKLPATSHARFFMGPSDFTGVYYLWCFFDRAGTEVYPITIRHGQGCRNMNLFPREMTRRCAPEDLVEHCNPYKDTMQTKWTNLAQEISPSLALYMFQKALKEHDKKNPLPKECRPAQKRFGILAAQKNMQDEANASWDRYLQWTKTPRFQLLDKFLTTGWHNSALDEIKLMGDDDSRQIISTTPIYMGGKADLPNNTETFESLNVMVALFAREEYMFNSCITGDLDAALDNFKQSGGTIPPKIDLLEIMGIFCSSAVAESCRRRITGAAWHQAR
jgi:ankyrin repeat protein